MNSNTHLNDYIYRIVGLFPKVQIFLNGHAALAGFRNLQSKQSKNSREWDLTQTYAYIHEHLDAGDRQDACL